MIVSRDLLGHLKKSILYFLLWLSIKGFQALIRKISQSIQNVPCPRCFSGRDAFYHFYGVESIGSRIKSSKYLVAPLTVASSTTQRSIVSPKAFQLCFPLFYCTGVHIFQHTVDAYMSHQGPCKNNVATDMSQLRRPSLSYSAGLLWGPHH